MSRDTTPMPPLTGAPATPDPDTCAGVVEMVTEYLEGALDDSSRARFEGHLAGCDECATYLDQMRATIAAAGHVDVDRVAPAVLERLVAAFRSIYAGGSLPNDVESGQGEHAEDGESGTFAEGKRLG
jgi:Putative zinc-finger